jgi:hypothetical protein
MKLPRLSLGGTGEGERHLSMKDGILPNGCGLGKKIACAAAVAACAAACATGVGVPACAACFASVGAGSCIDCA